MTDVVPRPLTPEERAVLDLMLSVDFDGADALRAQVEDLRVTSTCGCGCPSINFHDGASGGIGIVAEAWTEAQDRSVLLFVDGERRLQSLELQWMTDEPPSGWPPPSELEVRAS